MAELDDFFAKKDKKKSKVKKFTASDLMTSAKFQSEDVAQAPVAPAPSSAPRKVEKKKEEVVESHQTDSPAEPVTAAQPRTRPAEAEDEEWGEFEQEKERDYSGLKIQKLQIQDYEEEEEEDEGEHELNEEGELVKREPTGPWNKITSQPTSSNAPAKVKEVVMDTPNTAGGVYIPPSIRNKTTSSSGATSGGRPKQGKKEKGAPDLNNEDFFPTLSAAVKIEQDNIKLKKFEQTERGFTEAKPSRSHSNRVAAQPGEDGPRFALGNKFSTLSNDD